MTISRSLRTGDRGNAVMRGLLALFTVLLAWGAGQAEAQPQDRFAGVPAQVQPFVDQGQVSGAVMLVADRTQILHLSAVGQSDLATGRRMRSDDIFWIASMSKPITAIAIAILADRGELSFDDPVAQYLPEFREQWVRQAGSGNRRTLVRAARPVTLRDLLTHTSGLGEYPVTGPHWTLAEMTRVIAHEPLQFQPGARWGYSTAGTDVLGRVVEVVSDMTFAEFMQQSLFDPLGMTDTAFWLSPEQLTRYARSYRPNPNTGALEDTVIHYMYGGAVADRDRPPLGGAGLFSTAEDVAKLYQMMINGGVHDGHRVLRPETVAELTRKQTGNLAARPGMPWGLGFSIIEDPSRMEANADYSSGSFGHGGAFGTNSWADPTRGLVRIFMIQRDAMVPPNADNSPMRRAFETAVASALAAPQR